MTEEGRSTARGWAFAGPALAWTLVFFVVPMALVLAYSGFRRIGGSLETTLSLANYERALGTPVFRSALANSIEVGLLTVAVSVLVAYPAAYLLAYRVPARWGRLLLALAVLPFWTSYVVRSYSWLLVLAREGVVNRALLGLGVVQEPITLANTRTATVIGFVHFFTMLMTLTIYASLVQIPASYRKAARDLGASGWRTLVHVTLPLSVPGVVVGAFLTFVLAIGDYITPQILGGARELLLPQAIMLQVQRTGDFPMAAALSVVLLAVIAVAYVPAARRFSLVTR
ncbi:MAG: spermidine/putrescine ABC transporter permease [Actinomycetota bacterium]|nr:MAG: spermidine/putrescine ABC transporter permease [Actinomycetota bacterium]